jgi:hypothetical protein
VGNHSKIGLDSSADALRALADGFTHFAPLEGCPEWFVTAVWLCAGERSFIASGSPQLLCGGVEACTLAIETPEALLARLKRDVDRIRPGQGLPEVPAELHPPAPSEPWTKGSVTVDVLERSAGTSGEPCSWMCGLLIRGDGGKRLLNATEESSLGLLVTEEPELIDTCVAKCSAAKPV